MNRKKQLCNKKKLQNQFICYKIFVRKDQNSVKKRVYFKILR